MKHDLETLRNGLEELMSLTLWIVATSEKDDIVTLYIKFHSYQMIELKNGMEKINKVIGDVKLIYANKEETDDNAHSLIFNKNDLKKLLIYGKLL